MDKKFELLIVDDDPSDVDLMREALNRLGNSHFKINLSSVDNGEQAMDYLKRRAPFENTARPDLIILDLNMPRKTGQEVLQEIKIADEFKNIPVVVFTTSNSAADAANCYKLGANTFITKAKDFAEFLKIVASIREYWFNIALLPVA